ncbi:hypothetical protein T484DRAFT_3566487 [Baffinella frigidus]|nr:hypothetical protein T484DRAFT_3566487 [Cryptophyta sp. CCMP2293]
MYAPLPRLCLRRSAERGRAYLSRGGPICPEAGLSVPRRPIRSEAGLSVLRRASLFRGGPVHPEVGLSIPFPSRKRGGAEACELCDEPVLRTMWPGGLNGPPTGPRQVLGPYGIRPLGPLGSSSSQHRRTPELVLQKRHASFRITFRLPGAEDPSSGGPVRPEAGLSRAAGQKPESVPRRACES